MRARSCQVKHPCLNLLNEHKNKYGRCVTLWLQEKNGSKLLLRAYFLYQNK